MWEGLGFGTGTGTDTGTKCELHWPKKNLAEDLESLESCRNIFPPALQELVYWVCVFCRSAGEECRLATYIRRQCIIHSV